MKREIDDDQIIRGKLSKNDTRTVLKSDEIIFLQNILDFFN